MQTKQILLSLVAVVAMGTVMAIGVHIINIETFAKASIEGGSIGAQKAQDAFQQALQQFKSDLDTKGEAVIVDTLVVPKSMCK